MGFQDKFSGVLGAVVASEYGKSKKREQEAYEHEKRVDKSYRDKAYSTYGELLAGANEKQRKNLIARQEEAETLVQEYLEAAEFQRRSMKARIEELGGERTKAGSELEALGQKQKKETYEAYKAKMEQLMKRKYNKGGRK